MSNRTLTQMTAVVRELAHDRTGKDYSTTMATYRLQDALRELTDRLLDHDDGREALWTVSAELTADDDGRVAIPADCLRLGDDDVAVEIEGVWVPLRRMDRPPWQQTRVGDLQSAVEVMLYSETGDGSTLTGWYPDFSRDYIQLHPEDDAAGAAVTIGYYAAPTFPAANGTLALPDGADELLEYLAADKLILVESQDQKRLVTYATVFEGRFRHYCRSRCRRSTGHVQRYISPEE